ncbi:MAG: hypothetical protein Pars92KO_30680 [Parasphingorhabdus sp.]
MRMLLVALPPLPHHPVPDPADLLAAGTVCPRSVALLVPPFWQVLAELAPETSYGGMMHSARTGR